MMLIAKEIDAGGVMIEAPPEEPEEPEWGGPPADWSPWHMEIGAMHHLIYLPRLALPSGNTNPWAVHMLGRWEKWWEGRDRIVALTRWPTFHTELSTVCLGIGGLGRLDAPYESAAFVRGKVHVLERYWTRQQAWVGHHDLAYYRPWLQCEDDEKEDDDV